MAGLNGRLTGGRELSYVYEDDSYYGSLFRKIINAVNSLADGVAASPVGKVSPPHPIDSVQVQGAYNSGTNTTTCSGELLHWTITHNQSVKKGVQYLSEIDTSPNFSQPHVVDHGCSRSGFMTLPTFLSDGHTTQTYYLRSYAQYHGSNPQKPTVFGGMNNPTKIVMSGTTGTTLLSSQGSGTATNGQQAAKGLGTVLTRPSPGPKRNLV